MEHSAEHRLGKRCAMLCKERSAMILVLDIGNTTAALGIYTDGTLQQVLRYRESHRNDRRDFPDWLREQFHCLGPANISGAMVSSVVPSLNDSVLHVMEECGIRVELLSEPADVGIPICGYDTANLGIDRLVDCAGALEEFPPPLLVFDLGTASTLSVVNAEGCFIGGMILPGLRLSLDALTAGAEKLPPVELKEPKGLIGFDTVSCMQNGALYGAAGAIDGIVERVKEACGPGLTCVLTGGTAMPLLPLLRTPFMYRPNLIFSGLYAVARRRFAF